MLVDYIFDNNVVVSLSLSLSLSLSMREHPESRLLHPPAAGGGDNSIARETG
ncbi:MAG: hypothetical protein J8272_00785 ['Prunus persica' phytoplasma PP2]|nr:hypothetical protein ['Prunus persica' phytoplasma PP2]